jgi:hypothetical protein
VLLAKSTIAPTRASSSCGSGAALFVLVQEAQRMSVCNVQTWEGSTFLKKSSDDGDIDDDVGGQSTAPHLGASCRLSYCCCSVALRILETTILIVAVDSINSSSSSSFTSSIAQTTTDGADSVTSKLFAAVGTHLRDQGLPSFDPTLFYDYTIVINAPPLVNLARYSNSVQVATNNQAQLVAKRGVTFAELLVPVTRIHASKFSDIPHGRQLVVLRKVVYSSLAKEDILHDRQDVTQRALLWSNVSFDRFNLLTGKLCLEDEDHNGDQQVDNDGGGCSIAMRLTTEAKLTKTTTATVTGAPYHVDPCAPYTRSCARSAAASGREEDEEDEGVAVGGSSPVSARHRTVLLANSMPEYYHTRMILVAVEGIGTSIIPLEKFDVGEVALSAKVIRNGIEVGSFDVELSCQRCRTWRQTAAAAAANLSDE